MIFVEDDVVKVDGVVLPGVVKSIQVTESARIDEQEVEGSSARPKQATGYEDAKVNIELILDDTETAGKYDRLSALRSIFRKPGQTVPQPVSIVCEDTAAHGVTTVLFKGLSHKAEQKKGQLPVTLEFWEYIPQTITATRSGGPSAPAASSGGGDAPASHLSSDYLDYMAEGRGVSPKNKGSPARDTARPKKGFSKIKDLPF